MIEIEREAGLLVLRLNRPDKANSVTKAMLEDLDAALAGEPPAALILTGAGKVFSAGADLDEARAGLATDGVWERLSARIAALPCLTIAALNGTLADAVGVEGAIHAAGDRTGFALMNGGLCLTARDLARYGLLIARRGAGVNGAQFGSAGFLEETAARGVPMPAPRGHLRYSNQFNTSGRWLGHGGYGGQYMLIDLQTGRVGVFLSVLDTEDGYFSAYYPPIIQMLADICAG